MDASKARFDDSSSVPTSLLLSQADGLWDDLQQLGETLTSEEMLWEPVSGCWSIRIQQDLPTHADWSPAPPIPPFTTIAWRLDHIGRSLAAHAGRLFEQGSFTHATHEAAADVKGAMQFVKTSFDLWRKGIAGSGEFVSEDIALEVIGFNDHHLRHLSEIQTVRDLYRWQQPLDEDPFIDACLRGDIERVLSLREREPSLVQRHLEDEHDVVLMAALMGRWDLLRALLDMGFPVERGEEAALHYAAAFAPLEVVRLLVEHDANIDRLDPEWRATPFGWAEYFDREQNAAYLKSLETTLDQIRP